MKSCLLWSLYKSFANASKSECFGYAEWVQKFQDKQTLILPSEYNTGGPRYSRTFYLRICLFTLEKWFKMTIFQSKMDFLSANSGFAVQNDPTYLPRITRETCSSQVSDHWIQCYNWRKIINQNWKEKKVVRKNKDFLCLAFFRVSSSSNFKRLLPQPIFQNVFTRRERYIHWLISRLVMPVLFISWFSPCFLLRPLLKNMITKKAKERWKIINL